MIQGDGKGRCHRSSWESRRITTCISITSQGYINGYLIMGQSHTMFLSSTREGDREGEREPKEVEGRQACLASNQGFQDTGKLMQEIKLSHNGHVDCPCQSPAHWKSELVEYVIRVLFHATPFSGGHLSSH